MSGFSEYYANKIIDHMLRGVAFTPPATIYVALFTAVTGLEANNPTAEVSGGAYARVAVTLSAASGRITANSGAVTFVEASANWGTVTHLALVDHISNVNWGTGVNVLEWNVATVAKAVNTGSVASFAIGDIDVTVPQSA